MVLAVVALGLSVIVEEVYYGGLRLLLRCLMRALFRRYLHSTEAERLSGLWEVSTLAPLML